MRPVKIKSVEMRPEPRRSAMVCPAVKRVGDPELEAEKLHRTARRGFLTAELVIAMAVLTVILSFTLPHLAGIHYGDRVADRAFIHRLKSAILDQRIRALTDPGRSYSITVDGTGCVDFKCGAAIYRKLSGPAYQVFVQKGVRTDIMSTINFRNRTWGGQDGFTLGIWKNGHHLANLVFQVGTSTFREEYYGD